MKDEVDILDLGGHVVSLEDLTDITATSPEQIIGVLGVLFVVLGIVFYFRWKYEERVGG